MKVGQGFREKFSEKKARKWMWVGLLVFVALQIYFVQEMLAALILFTGVFVILAIGALVLYLVDRAGQWGLGWAGGTPVRPLNLRAVDGQRPRTLVKSHSTVHVQRLPGNRARLT